MDKWKCYPKYTKLYLREWLFELSCWNFNRIIIIFTCVSDALLADLQNTISPPPPAPSGRVTPNYNSLNGSFSLGDYATINSSKSDRTNSRLAKSPPKSVINYLLIHYHSLRDFIVDLFLIMTVMLKGVLLRVLFFYNSSPQFNSPLLKQKNDLQSINTLNWQILFIPRAAGWTSYNVLVNL